MKKTLGAAVLVVIFLMSSTLAMEPVLQGLKGKLGALGKTLGNLGQKISELKLSISKNGKAAKMLQDIIKDIDNINDLPEATKSFDSTEFKEVTKNFDPIEKVEGVIRRDASIKKVKASRRLWQGIFNYKNENAAWPMFIKDDSFQPYLPYLFSDENLDLKPKVRKFINFFCKEFKADKNPSYLEMQFCNCEGFYRNLRLMLILMQANDILKKFQKKHIDETFVHISLASGKLLQTFLLVLALRYFGLQQPIKIIAIDPLYEDPKQDGEEARDALESFRNITQGCKVEIEEYKDTLGFFKKTGSKKEIIAHSFDMIDLMDSLKGLLFEYTLVSTMKSFPIPKEWRIIKTVIGNKSALAYNPYISVPEEYVPYLTFPPTEDENLVKLLKSAWEINKNLEMDTKSVESVNNPITSKEVKVKMRFFEFIPADFKFLVDYYRADDDPIIYVGVGSDHINDSKGHEANKIIEKYEKAYFGLWEYKKVLTQAGVAV